MILNKQRLIFISENPALKSKGSGISVLLHNILFALKEKSLELITFCGNEKISDYEIIADNPDVDILVCDAKLNSFYKIKLINKVIIAFSFILSLRKIGKIINSQNVLVITLVGASSGPLWKYLLLKLLFKKAKHGLYIVDDLELINKKLSNKIELVLIKNLLPMAIKSSDFLIAISYGLRDTYFNQFGKESYILLPHFQKKEPLNKKSTTSTFTFLFTGGLSFLYNEPLLEFALVLNEINKSGVCSKILNLQIQTYTAKAEFNNLGFEPSTAFYSTVNSRNELINVYNNCDCFIIPYSFDNADEQIVKTSFPQKVAEIIQYEKPILIYGPAYSSVTQFFSGNTLNYVCDSKNRQDLKDILLKIVNQADRFDGKEYTKAYNNFLSAKMVNNVFNDISNEIIVNYEN